MRRNETGARNCWLRAAMAGALLGCWGTASAQGVASTTPSTGTTVAGDLMSMELEDLLRVRVKVTSAGRKPQSVREAPSAIHVLTSEDIRRAGVTNIPDALRLVPGLNVARIDANKWSITSRGFGGRFANKLLVMIDGRSVYTPLFSGVFWDVQGTMLEDVERIEVIRGPGSSLHGANAVNGVINIITKSARDTQGSLLVFGGGSEEEAFGAFRHGATAGEKTHYRLYAKSFERDEAVDFTDNPTNDDWSLSQAGFRFDDESKKRDVITFKGDFYNGRSGGRSLAARLTAPFVQSLTDDTPVSGGNLVFRLRRRYSEDSDMVLHLYYDRTERDNPILRQEQDTLDFDFQHRFRLDGRNEIVWGLGARLMDDENEARDNVVLLDPISRDTRIYSAFLQDEIRLTEENDLRLTLGSKIEHNSYTGIEVQPNARLLWLADAKQSVWAAVSRAVRTPSRVESDGRVNASALFLPSNPPAVPFPPPGVVALTSLMGSPEYDSEELLARELGYRLEPNARLSIDAALFYNSYNKLRSLEPGAPFLETNPLPPHLVAPFTASNKLAADTWGAELAADWKATEAWRLRAGYTYLRIDVDPDRDSRDPTALAAERESPDHQLFLSSMLELSKRLELDAHARYVDSVPGLGVPSYFTLDLRLGWHPERDLELSLVGRDLLDSRHEEAIPTILRTERTLVERSFYGKVTWRF